MLKLGIVWKLMRFCDSAGGDDVIVFAWPNALSPWWIQILRRMFCVVVLIYFKCIQWHLMHTDQKVWCQHSCPDLDMDNVSRVWPGFLVMTKWPGDHLLAAVQAQLAGRLPLQCPDPRSVPAPHPAINQSCSRPGLLPVAPGARVRRVARGHLAHTVAKLRWHGGVHAELMQGERCCDAKSLESCQNIIFLQAIHWNLAN